MALVAAAVANDGVSVAPHVGVALRDAAGATVRSLDGGPGVRLMSSATARTLRSAMQAAVDQPGAFAAGARIAGVAVAGKTGTAEVGGGAVPHGWFIGFAPAGDVQVAIAVVLENAPRGGEDAAPVAAAVFRALLRR